MLAGYRMLRRAVLQRLFDHLASRFFHYFLDCNRHFLRFALAHADTAVAIANYRQRCETHDTTTLNDLRYTVDRDHFFAHAIIRLVALHLRLHFCHDDLSLELQAGFTRGISQHLDATVITETGAVKRHF